MIPPPPPPFMSSAQQGKKRGKSEELTSYAKMDSRFSPRSVLLSLGLSFHCHAASGELSGTSLPSPPVRNMETLERLWWQSLGVKFARGLPSFLLLRQPSRNGEEPAIIPRRMDGKVLVLLVLLLLLGLAQYVAPLLLLLLQLPPFSQAGPPLLLPPLTQDFPPSNSRLRFSASLPLSPSPPVPASGEYSAILPPSSPEYIRAAGRKPSF